MLNGIQIPRAIPFNKQAFVTYLVKVSPKVKSIIFNFKKTLNVKKNPDIIDQSFFDS